MVGHTGDSKTPGDEETLILYHEDVRKNENNHGFFFFFYALLSHDNDLLSLYLNITKIVFSW